MLVGGKRTKNGCQLFVGHSLSIVPYPDGQGGSVFIVILGDLNTEFGPRIVSHCVNGVGGKIQNNPLKQRGICHDMTVMLEDGC